MMPVIPGLKQATKDGEGKRKNTQKGWFTINRKQIEIGAAE